MIGESYVAMKLVKPGPNWNDSKRLLNCIVNTHNFDR
jgi:hypothetical protein